MKGQEISMKSKNFRKGPFERLLMKFFYFMLQSLNVELLRRHKRFCCVFNSKSCDMAEIIIFWSIINYHSPSLIYNNLFIHNILSLLIPKIYFASTLNDDNESSYILSVSMVKITNFDFNKSSKWSCDTSN